MDFYNPLLSTPLVPDSSSDYLSIINLLHSVTSLKDLKVVVKVICKNT